MYLVEESPLRYTMNPMSLMNTIQSFFRRMWVFVRSHVKTTIAVVLVVIIAGAIVATRDGNTLVQKTVKAQVGSVVQDVSVTGRVKAAETADLSFERSGKITSVSTSIGKYVNRGQVLVQLDIGELAAQRQQAVAGIAVAETSVASAERLLNETIASSITSAVNALVTLTDVQFTYFNNTNPESSAVADTKARALKALYGEDDLGRVQSWYFLRLTPILAAESGDDIASEKIADSARTTKTMLATVIQASDAITNALSNITASATDKATIIATRNALQGQVTAIVSAQNALSSATSQLQQATTSIASLDAQITKYALYAPFSGVVTALDAKRGEIANPGIVAVSLMNTSRFEIEATIAEADIAKLKVGNQATVKLDAYGSGVSFQARIVRIDPAGKIIEGVATYKVTLQFTSTDNRILAGLTADIDIHSDQHDHVVFIPTRNIITKDGNKFVKILVQNQNVDARFANMTVVLENESERVIEIPVTIGLRGSDGRTEIISGIRDGDVIVAD